MGAAWVVLGSIVGVVAKFLLLGRHRGGFIVPVGIASPVVGGFLGRAFAWYRLYRLIGRWAGRV